MPFPDIDPIALRIGPIALHWYGLAYVAGIVGWWLNTIWLTKLSPLLNRKDIDDYLTWAVLGVILGGRLGYVLFYKPDFYFTHPVEIVKVWKGGMAFHGGVLGVIVATYIYTKRRNISFLDFTDVAICGVPLGLFFGRIANFINGELFGRVTDSPWGMIFPMGGPEPRHPSQLYEAALEGVLLYMILMISAAVFRMTERRGVLTGLFLVGYAITRSTAELFREPDAFLGFLWAGMTMGQLLCLPLLAWGLWLLFSAQPRNHT